MGTLEKILNLLKMKNEVKSYSVKMYAEMKLDDGRIVATEDEQFMIGSRVFAISDDGEAAPLEAGNYTMENGNKMTIGDDSEILDLGEEKEAEDVEAKEEEEMSEEETDKSEEPIMLSSEFASELMTRIEELESKIVKLSKEPATEGIEYNPEGANINSTIDLTKLSMEERTAYYINNLK
jgi:hypothetical protein